VIGLETAWILKPEEIEMSGCNLLEVQGLSVSFPSRHGYVRAVTNVSFDLNGGEILGIVGESGCGKSTLCSALVDMLPQDAIVEGFIRYKGEDLLRGPKSRVRKLRGREITTVLQNPMTALDPLFTVGAQFDEFLRCNSEMGKKQRLEKMRQMVESVGISEPDQRLASYPHQLSGGMKQRFLIAMATALKPGILLADEPTTALDVTIQEQILHLLSQVRRRQQTAIVLITHDLGIVKRFTDRLMIMYAGSVVESGPTEDVFSNPLHPYTQALLASIPTLNNSVERLTGIEGQIPDLARLPPGCAFAQRCSRASEACLHLDLSPVAVHPQHQVSCYLYRGEVK
jgi:oligopeptide/dipeptide ABC transporter ATP-binding protein